jgi:hypothetical protein
MGRGSRAFRKRASIARDGNLSDVEFAELLDPITRVQPQFETAPEPIADEVSVPVVDDVPVADEVPVKSRFADAGLDDDRLPVQPAKRRSSRR